MSQHREYGFSLIELSIVLFISALLLRSAIVPLPQIRDSAMRKQMQAQLREVKQALIGHVIRTGVLPCPISLAGSADDGANECRLLEGGLPAETLGFLGSVNAAGAVLDVWGRPLRYALSQADHKSAGVVGSLDWSVPGEISAIGLNNVQAELRLCLNTKTTCTKQALRADQLVVIVLSDGGDATNDGAQLENQDGDSDYALTAYSKVEGESFDDMLITLSRSDVAYWLLRADWLE